jgi:hydroxypyruvate isomerase
VSLRLCANLNFLFTEVPLLDRFEAAAAAGFRGVELLAPYEAPAAALRARLDAAGLSAVLINSFAGDREKGERGMACLPGKEPAFRDSIERSLEYASALGCGMIHFMGGVKPDDVPFDLAAALYATRLAWAAERARAAGVRLMLEAINQRDIPGYVVRTQEQAAALVKAIGTDSVGLQFDIYHCQTAQGDVTRRLEALMPLIGHIQVADVPSRSEPGTGEVGWDFLFGRIEALGYQGWIGCEYKPAGETGVGLAWRRRFGIEGESTR